MATYNARTMAATGKHGVGRTADVLQQCSDAGCDIVGLQETRRSGHSTLKAGGYIVYFSGETGLDGEKKGQGGVGLAVKAGITRNTPCTPEFAGDRLLKISLDLHGRAHAVTFVVGYAPTDTHDDASKNRFWGALSRLVEDVPPRHQLFVLMDANARTRKREETGRGRERIQQ